MGRAADSPSGRAVSFLARASRQGRAPQHLGRLIRLPVARGSERGHLAWLATRLLAHLTLARPVMRAIWAVPGLQEVAAWTAKDNPITRLRKYMVRVMPA